MGIFSNLVSVGVYNFGYYNYKGHIPKYLNPKKGTGLARNNGKPIHRTLEGAIYFLHS